MIALSTNEIIWQELIKDPVFNAKYDKYRAQYGPDFRPFFPVSDNYAGDISWDDEIYFIFDAVSFPPNRNVFGERYSQVLYTIVGKVNELLNIQEDIIHIFSFWESGQHPDPTGNYRITNMDSWIPLRTQSRDSLRQTHAIEMLVNVNYFLCDPSGKI
jgi:hypothetical protein